MKRLISIAVGIVLTVFLINSFSSFYVEFLWFESMKYADAFWTMYTTEYLVGSVYFIVFWLVAAINLMIASKGTPLWANTGSEVFQQQLAMMSGSLRFVFFAALVFVGYVMSVAPASNWMRVLQYFDSEPFGAVDAVFGKDLGYYVFQLPFYQSIVGWLKGVVIVSVVASLAVYLFRRSVLFLPQGIRASNYAKTHLMALVCTFLLLYAFDYNLSAYDILYKDNGIVVGASYTDVHATLLGYRVMTVMAILAAVAVIISAFRKSMKYFLVSVGLWVGAAVIFLGVYPSLIQKFIVKPNELELEKPYIEEGIRATRKAYELDKITERDFNYEVNLTREDIDKNNLTIKNITLWDYRPLRDSYSQLQEIRPYYSFVDVDIDRYVIDGEYRQVMLSARELNLAKLGGADNWINKTFIYTHGHGVVVSPVNRVSSEGQPEFFMKNIPPETTVDMKLERPEIYFGETQAIDDYVIVKTSKEEFDYPLGEKNQQTFYKEDAGVGIGTFARRLLFAIQFGKLNLLLNDYIQPQSKILYHRNVQERVSRIIPYIKLDKDPYMVIENGRLYWIYDGFTTTDQFPYAKMSFVRGTTPFDAGHSFNYIRNSVKVVVDAYNGATEIYSFRPENDPVIRVFAKIFPDVFKPLDQMPEYLKRHLRYPQDLFDIQARLFSVYHMEDANVFYNREDIWNIAEEKYGDAVQPMESYYIIMKLPDAEKEEFLIMIPFTPNNKPNMIAWFCARSDGENYGKLLVYKFPKSELVYGPIQVESRIDQTPEISEKLTLWNQQGSQVTRGNLLAIPINNSLLYVEPLYLQSSQSRLPELKKVIVAFGNNIYMEDNLEAGLAKLFGGVNYGERPTTSGRLASEQPKDAQSDNRLEAIRTLSASAMQNYQKAQEALRNGQWSKYGEFIDKLRQDLEAMNLRSKK